MLKYALVCELAIFVQQIISDTVLFVRVPFVVRPFENCQMDRRQTKR